MINLNRFKEEKNRSARMDINVITHLINSH